MRLKSNLKTPQTKTMKKVIAILFVACVASLAACTSKTETAVDSTLATADSTITATADSATSAIDSAATATVDSLKK